jgi:hypothetical protein
MLSNALTRDCDLQPPAHHLCQQLRRPTRARNAKVARGALQAGVQELLDRWGDGRRPTGVGFFQQPALPIRHEAFQPAPHGIITLACQLGNFCHGVTIR